LCVCDQRNLVIRIAAIYDIHANLPALEAVLQEIRQADVDCIVVGGDVVPGPLPRETIQCLLGLEIPVQFINGNGNREVLAHMSGYETDWYRAAPEQWREPVRWTAQQLDSQHQRPLESWPPTFRVAIPSLGDVLFCHATPRNDNEIFTRLTPDDRLLPIFEGLGVSVVVCGHTHMQFDRMVCTARGGRTQSGGWRSHHQQVGTYSFRQRSDSRGHFTWDDQMLDRQLVRFIEGPRK
jgi:predicted phosphodiesterase